MISTRRLTWTLIIGVAVVGALVLGLQRASARAQGIELRTKASLETHLSTEQTSAIAVDEPAAQQTFVPTWGTERVDVEKTFAGMTDRSLALDDANRPHIAYGADHLYYAWYDGSMWHRETVDPAWGVGWYASLALDSNGNPHISYHDDINGGLKYAHYDGSRWRIETVDGSGDVGSYTSIALDGSGRPHISYRDDTSESLKYAHYDGGIWRIDIVDNRVWGNGGTSLALDSGGKPHVSYGQRWFEQGCSCTIYQLGYAYWTGSTWTTQTIASGTSVGQYTSLALDSSNHPHISYLDGGKQDLNYAWWTGSAWITETVDSSAGWAFVKTSIALDSSGNPRIAYTDTDSGYLMYARRAGSVWTLETVDTGERAGYKSLAIDTAGGPHIIYQGSVSDDLKCAKLTGSTWNIQIVDDGVSAGAYASLALAPTAPYTPNISYDAENSLRYAYFDGSAWRIAIVEDVPVYGTSLALAATAPYTPQIAYYASSSGRVTYAYWTGSAWLTETVDSVGESLWGIALALAPTTPYTPHIAYIGGGGDLRYARRTSGGWTIETVDRRTNSVLKLESPSLALDPTAPYDPRVSYHDTDNGNLRYARRTNSGWITETIGFIGSSSEPTSLALDSSGKPCIAYEEYSDLKYIRWTGSVWVIETVDGNVDGYSASLVLDSTDRPRISYYGSKSLKYAKYDGSRWITETVDGLGNVGSYASLALDRDGRSRIAYYDLTNGDLKFAWQTRVDVVPTIGGTFGAFGSTAFDFPADTVTDTVVLTYTVLQPSASLPHIGVFFDINAVYASTGQIAQIAPGKTYTVVVNYDEANVPAYMNESGLALYYWDSSSSQWIKEPTSVVDTIKNTITATPNHFSVWTALGETHRVFLPVILRNY